MTAPATEALGALAVEAVAIDEEFKGDLEPPPMRMFRPAGIPLLNDGVFHHWMMPGETYRLEHDGIGWRVSARSFVGGHIYRLANRDGRYVDTLPLANGEIHLDRTKAYELQESRPSLWIMREVGLVGS